jgi:hypothetical protein
MVFIVISGSTTSSIAYNNPNDGIAIKTKIKLGIKVQIISIVVW